MEIAIGIITNAEGCVLVQKRTQRSIAAGFWEFPGGKVEAGEDCIDALKREIFEELGIHIRQPLRWLRRSHAGTGELHLNFYRISDWEGTIGGKEGQVIEWRALDNLPSPFLDLSKKIWKWLSLPPTCTITAAEVIGVEQTIRQLPSLLCHPIMLQFRSKQLSSQDRQRLFTAIQLSPKNRNALVLVNDDEEYAKQSDGIHLSSSQLWKQKNRPDYRWVGASCHTLEDIVWASKINVDFVVLSPVLKTLTHVEVPAMGWEKFSQIVKKVDIPVYALGGLAASDLTQAQQCGAQGVAFMRQGWS